MEHLGRPLPEDRDSYYADIEDNKNNDNKISQAKDIAALICPSRGTRPTKTSKDQAISTQDIVSNLIVSKIYHHFLVYIIFLAAGHKQKAPD